MPTFGDYMKHKRRINPTEVNDGFAEYNPILAVWLIELALILKWYRPQRSSRNCSCPEIFEDDDFCAITGITIIKDVDDDNRPLRRGEPNPEETTRFTPAFYKNLLKERLEKVRKTQVSEDLPLFNNIRLLTELIGLSEADKILLIVASAVNLFPVFRSAISERRIHTSNQFLCQLLSHLSGLPERDFISSISDKSILITTGMVKISRGVRDFEDKIDLMDGLSAVFLTPHSSIDELVGKFLKRAAVPTLSLDNFPHLKNDTGVVVPYLQNSLENRTEGVNILLHGSSGVGKTEYVLAIAAKLGVDLYEINFADDDGDPIKGEGRLRAYSLCQNLLSKTGNALLIFDEIEDVFPSDGSAFMRMLIGSKNSHGDSCGKAWINRTMECNPVPALWISNRIKQIDPAYLRRFDYSIPFPIPPAPVRKSIAKHHLNCFNPPAGWLDRISASEETTPGQLDRAAKVARIASNGDNLRAIELVEQTLGRSATLMGQKKMPSRNVVTTGYSLEYLNTDMDITTIISGLQRRVRGTFCFYGAAGTGKSELARYIADQIGKPLILRRASDILDKYVGESEKNIASMFSEAREQDAVLVLDEADSFLTDRQNAQRSWEVTQVNELLTQMEAFEGIFICTTNLMEKLDPASLRRFAFKIQFDPLTQQQRLNMFRNELVRLGGDENEVTTFESKINTLDRLTPGDFAVAARQFDLWDIKATSEKLFEQLLKECKAKGSISRKIGFGE